MQRPEFKQMQKVKADDPISDDEKYCDVEFFDDNYSAGSFNSHNSHASTKSETHEERVQRSLIYRQLLVPNPNNIRVSRCERVFNFFTSILNRH